MFLFEDLSALYGDDAFERCSLTGSIQGVLMGLFIGITILTADKIIKRHVRKTVRESESLNDDADIDGNSCPDKCCGSSLMQS